MAGDAAVAVVGGLGGALLTQAVNVWAHLHSSRREDKRERSAELERSRDELLVQLHSVGAELDRLEAEMRIGDDRLREAVTDLRERLAGIEALIGTFVVPPRRKG